MTRAGVEWPNLKPGGGIRQNDLWAVRSRDRPECVIDQIVKVGELEIVRELVLTVTAALTGNAGHDEQVVLSNFERSVDTPRQRVNRAYVGRQQRADICAEHCPPPAFAKSEPVQRDQKNEGHQRNDSEIVAHVS